VRCALFQEPDIGDQYTAFATEVVYGDRRLLFKNVQLAGNRSNWSKKEKAMSNQVFETKWGYVAYSYGDYKKLKEINKIFQKARTAAAQWNRWNRKDEHNRVQKRWIRNDKGQKTGYEVVGPLPEPKVCELFSKKHRWYDEYVTDNAVELEYRKSRKPVAIREDVEPPRWTSEEITDLLIKAKAWESSL